MEQYLVVNGGDKISLWWNVKRNDVRKNRTTSVILWYCRTHKSPASPTLFLQLLMRGFSSLDPTPFLKSQSHRLFRTRRYTSAGENNCHANAKTTRSTTPFVFVVVFTSTHPHKHNHIHIYIHARGMLDIIMTAVVLMHAVFGNTPTINLVI